MMRTVIELYNISVVLTFIMAFVYHALRAQPTTAAFFSRKTKMSVGVKGNF